VAQTELTTSGNLKPMQRQPKDNLILLLSGAAVIAGIAILAYAFAFEGNGGTAPQDEPPQQAQQATTEPISVPPTQATSSEAAPGQCPSGCPIATSGCLIKGDINAQGEKLYYPSGSPGYDRAVISPSLGERWFCTPAEAEANGFKAAQN
jgi:hypothetical protein